MDNAQGSGPAAGAGAAVAGGDWRSQLPPGGRNRVVNKIMEMLNKHLPATAPEELEKMAVESEQKIYAAATNQADYVRKISVKMLFVESQDKINTQQNPRNGQVVQNQRPCNLASSGSTSRTGYSGACDLKKELDQMNKTLKYQYRAGLSDLYEISMKVHGDNHVPTQQPKETHEQVNYKLILERSLHSIQFNKKISLEEGVPIYKRQITSILNSEKWMPGQTFQQSAGQAPSTSSTGIGLANGVQWPETTNMKRRRPSPVDDIHN